MEVENEGLSDSFSSIQREEKSYQIVFLPFLVNNWQDHFCLKENLKSINI